MIYLALTAAFAIGMGLAVAEEKSVVGVVEQTRTGLMLITKQGEYLISSGNLARMLGKTIKAVGVITEENKIKKISILSAEEVVKPMAVSPIGNLKHDCRNRTSA